MDIRICEHLTREQDMTRVYNGERRRYRPHPELGWMRKYPIACGSHERRTTLASHFVNDWNVSVWVQVGSTEYGFMEWPNQGSMTELTIWADKDGIWERAW